MTILEEDHDGLWEVTLSPLGVRQRHLVKPSAAWTEKRASDTAAMLAQREAQRQ